MNKNLFIFLTAVAITLSFQSCGKNYQVSGGKPIVILYDNDVHCGTDADGYAQAVGLRSAINAADTAACLLVSAGDYVQGSITGLKTKGGDMVTILNRAHYDAVAIGNHELDFGMPRLLQLLSRLNAPKTCANLTEIATGKTLVDRYVMVSAGKRKVAFVGALTPDALLGERPAFYDEKGNQIYDINTAEIARMVQSAADDARKEGADYVIALSHLGETSQDFSSNDLVARTRGIDAVIDGHSHSRVDSKFVRNLDGKEVMVTQTGTKFVNLGKMYIGADGRISTELLPMCDIKVSDPAVKSVVDSVRNEIAKEFGPVIACSEVKLTINGKDGKRAIRREETNLGDLVADANRVVSGSRLSIAIGAAIRVDLPAGDISKKQIVEVSPLGYDIITVELTGNGLAAALGICSKGVDKGIENPAFAHVSGFRYAIHTGGGPLVSVSDIEILDSATGTYSPLSPDGKYVLAINEMAFMTMAGKVAEYRVLSRVGADFEVLTRYIVDSLGGKIGREYAEPQGRVRFVD